VKATFAGKMKVAREFSFPARAMGILPVQNWHCDRHFFVDDYETANLERALS
jgi:hypothetical protein